MHAITLTRTRKGRTVPSKKDEASFYWPCPTNLDPNVYFPLCRQWKESHNDGLETYLMMPSCGLLTTTTTSTTTKAAVYYASLATKGHFHRLPRSTKGRPGFSTGCQATSTSYFCVRASKPSFPWVTECYCSRRSIVVVVVTSDTRMSSARLQKVKILTVRCLKSSLLALQRNHRDLKTLTHLPLVNVQKRMVWIGTDTLDREV